MSLADEVARLETRNAEREQCPEMGEAGHCMCWDDDDNGEPCCFCEGGFSNCQSDGGDNDD